MDRSKYDKKSQHSFINIIVWSVGILLMLTMLSGWFVNGVFAKYVIGDSYSDSAHVAGANAQLELLEHEANLNGGIYELNENKEVTKNTYEKVIPGVDIAKDPFIRLDIDDSEIAYELYIQVTESNPFPATVTYDLTEDWELVDEVSGIYKYKNVFEAGTPYDDEIKILKNDKLYVSEHYVGSLQEFTLTFKAWLRQANSN